MPMAEPTEQERPSWDREIGMAEDLFRSNDLLVRRVTECDSAACVVTFDSFTDLRTLDRPGFGETFLREAGIDAVHVLSRDNDWYQYTETLAAMEAVRAVTQGYARVVTYGSSMGGYAAIRLAERAGANAVLALSPQFSINHAIVPWERRWPASSKRFKSVWENTLPFPRIQDAYVAFDPSNEDQRHIDLLAAQFAFQPVPITRGGHPVTGLLAQLGLLQRGIAAVCDGRFDGAAFQREAWQRRKQAPQYLLNLASATPTWRRSRRIALVRAASQMTPLDAGIHCQLGFELGRAGRFEESLASHRHALELAPGHPHLTWVYSFSLEASGDLDGAHALMEALVTGTVGAAIYLPRLRKLRARITWRNRLKYLPWRPPLTRRSRSQRLDEAKLKPT
jgi:alpha-beta hydrolase superfamily lysophospholipase